jgi:prenyltransferase beta subunit
VSGSLSKPYQPQGEHAVHTRLALAFVLLIPTLSMGQTADETKATINYLHSMQRADGIFLNVTLLKLKDARETEPSLQATSAGIRALKNFGADVPHPTRASIFIASCLDERTGGYSPGPGQKTSVAVTAVGIMAAVELGMKPERFINQSVHYLAENAKDFEEVRLAAAGFEAANQFPKAAVDRWLAQIGKMRNADGSYGEPIGDGRMTGGAVALVLRIGGKLDDAERKASLQVLVAAQRPDGGFGKADVKVSDLETSYRVMRAFHMLNEKPKDTAKLTEFVAACRHADGGYGVTPKQPSDVSGTYYASVILKWLK